MCIGLRVNYRFSCQIFLNFRDRSSQNTQISDFMKIRLVGAELFLAGGRMDGQTWRRWQ